MDFCYSISYTWAKATQGFISPFRPIFLTLSEFILSAFSFILSANFSLPINIYFYYGVIPINSDAYGFNLVIGIFPFESSAGKTILWNYLSFLANSLIAIWSSVSFLNTFCLSFMLIYSPNIIASVLIAANSRSFCNASSISFSFYFMRSCYFSGSEKS